MKKIIGFVAAVFSFLFVFVLASCGSSSGVEVAETHTVTASKITFKLTFAENENISNGTAVPHIKKYAYDEDAEDHVGTYDKDTTVTFSSGVYTSSTVSFTSLTKDTTYVFRMYVTYNSNEELLDTWEVKTSASGDSETTATMISDKASFLAMADDPEGYYKLAGDIDFGGDSITALFSSTSSKRFTGTFDGDGYTVSNFKIDSNNTAIFNYTKDATIKNVIIDATLADLAEDEANVNADYSSGRATGDIAILAGNSESTTFENITIEHAGIVIKANSGATINAGMVVGYANKCSFKDVNVVDSILEFTDLRLTVTTGLFAGVIIGDSSYKEDGTAVACVDCSATGTLKGLLHYASTAGKAIVGGFVGNLGTASLVKNCYTTLDITLYRSAETTDKNNYSLCVGGFLGTNAGGSVNILGCAAVADVTVNAGEEGTEESTMQENVLANYYVYVGGFAGLLNKYIDKIENSVYVVKSTGVKVNAKATDDDEKALYTKSNVIAVSYTDANVKNTVCMNDSAFDATVLSDAIQEVIKNYYTAA